MAPNLDWMSNPVRTEISPFVRWFRDFHWSTTALGAISQWSRELKQTVRLMMADTTPVILYWGPERTIIYNEAYVPLVGDKHPNLLGRTALESFPDFWPGFEPIFSRMETSGKAEMGDASRLLMSRHGFLEETFFDWKLIPVISDDGQMLGAYGQPTDLTFTVIVERRTKCMQSLAQSCAEARSVTDLWENAMQVLGENDSDSPFALLVVDEALMKPLAQQPSNVFTTVASIGLHNGHPLCDTIFKGDPSEPNLADFFKEVTDKGSQVRISGQDIRIRQHLQDISWRGSGTPCHQLVGIPIGAGVHRPAVLLLGLNPHRPYNALYEGYITTISDVLSSSLSKHRLSEELKLKAETASKAARDFEQSEIRFSRFISRSTVGLVVTDLKGQILFANKFWYNFSDQDRQNTNAHLFDTILEEDLPAINVSWRNAALLKQTSTFTFRSKTPFDNGSNSMPYRTAYCACYADCDGSDDVETMMCVVIDISEQKWVESQLLLRSQELAASEEKYRKFADLCPLGIVSTDAQGYVQWGNEAWHAFYGFKKGDKLPPQPWLPWVVDEDLPAVKKYFRGLQTVKGPASVVFRLKRKYVIYEGDRVRENDVVALASGVQEFKADGSVDHIDFIVTDISAQKMAEKILAEKMEEAIRARTQQERFMDMISHEIRNPLSAVLHCGEEIAESMRKCLASVESSSPKVLGLYKSEQTWEASPMSHVLKGALEAASTISYCVQHQKSIIDDVLTLSKLDAELLVISSVPTGLSNLLDSAVKMFESELRMSDIQLDLVRDSSIQDNQVEWLLLDPNRLLQVIINLLTNSIKFTRARELRKIKLIASIHKTPPSDDDLDYVPRRFQPSNHEAEFVRQKRLGSDEDLFLRIAVSDTGRGLTNREKHLLFQRFAQADPKTHTEYGGSGLGLFISRQITEMLGGEIGVGSSPEGGCVFAFYVTTSQVMAPLSKHFKPASTQLPERSLSAPTMTPECLNAVSTHKDQEKGDINAPMIRKVKILVVEDNVINSRVLCKQLRNRDYMVDAASNGQEAIDMILRLQKSNENQYDVILMDVEMPIKNGLQATREIRLLEQDGLLPRHLPVIGVTANVRGKQVNSCIEAGMDSITTKPYRIDDLVTNIDKFSTKTDPD